MSINPISSYSQIQAPTDVQTAVAAKALDAQRADGASALKLLQSAVAPATPGLGETIDVHG